MDGMIASMRTGQTKPLLRALAGEKLSRPPWWLMRQAGRYLPEYRQLRARARDFVELCLTPELASEVTLQPVRRYGMDGAIIFSDILMLPYALGQKLEFQESHGPILERVEDQNGIAQLDLDGAVSKLEPVFEAVRRVRAMLSPQTTLIGFAGSPWTVATYMVEGGTTRDFQRVKSWAYRDPVGFGALMELLVAGTVANLAGQIAAGAEVVQLFDSWAGVLPEAGFERWVIEPTRRIVTAVKERSPGCPIIGFPRGAGLLYERYVSETGVDGVGLDTTVPVSYASETLQPLATAQGNLDPVLLLAGGAALERAATEIRQTLGRGSFVFNLGHGVLPETPLGNIEALARLLAEPIAA
jgi:uroporphyrinogen decarboxylase